MTRDEIKAQHKTVGPTIVEGKFAGCPIYAPHFWEVAGLGGADAREGVVEPGERAYLFEIDASDVETWPELASTRRLRIVEDANGFVHTFHEEW